MKQTVSILTALMITLLLVSGLIVKGSMQQSQMLLEREDQLLEKTMELQKAHVKITEMEKQTAEKQQMMDRVQKERDALSTQLGDALLSSQESNDAVARQTQMVQQLEAANDQLAQQLDRHRQRISQLEAELAEALLPRATPSPLRVERSVSPKQ